MTRKLRYTEEWKVGEDRLSYYLGLIAADGCLLDSTAKNKIELSLTEADRSTVVCFATSFVLEEPYIASVRGYPGLPKALFATSLPKFRVACEAIGLTPRKSHTLSVDFSLIKNRWYFLRGVLDGDGCVYISKRSTGDDRIMIYSASMKFLFQLKEQFGGIISQGSKCYVITFNKSSSVDLANHLPIGIEGMLERKDRKLLELLSRKIQRKRKIKAEDTNEKIEQ